MNLFVEDDTLCLQSDEPIEFLPLPIPLPVLRKKILQFKGHYTQISSDLAFSLFPQYLTLIYSPKILHALLSQCYYTILKQKVCPFGHHYEVKYQGGVLSWTIDDQYCLDYDVNNKIRAYRILMSLTWELFLENPNIEYFFASFANDSLYYRLAPYALVDIEEDQTLLLKTDTLLTILKN